MIRKAIFSIAGIMLAVSANALEVLDFEPSTYPGGWQYAESFEHGNFRFYNNTFTEYNFAITDSEYANNINNAYPDNGSAYVHFARNYDKFSRIDGQPFSLSYFDTSEYSTISAEYGNPKFWVVGLKSDGTEIITEFSRDRVFDGAGGGPDFERFYLPVTYTDLVGVEIRVYNSMTGEFGEIGAFDNIGIDEPVLVASSATRHNPDYVIPVSGGAVQFERVITNLTGDIQKAKRWEILYLDDGTPYAYQKFNSVKLGANAESRQASRSLSLPGWFPGGQMSYELSSLTESHPEISLAYFGLEKTVDDAVDTESVVIEVSSSPHEVNPSVPAEGGGILFTREIRNVADEGLAVRRWEIITFPNSKNYAYTAGRTVRIGYGNTSYQGSRKLSIPGWFPAGNYKYTYYAFTKNHHRIVSDSFGFSKSE